MGTKFSGSAEILRQNVYRQLAASLQMDLWYAKKVESILRLLRVARKNAVKCRRSNAAKIVDNVLQTDILIHSPSAAVSVVSGSAKNGNITRKTA